LQGALVGKGLIAANFGNPRKGIRFEEVGLCRAVDNAHELANEIQRLTCTDPLAHSHTKTPLATSLVVDQLVKHLV
ncbi:MAG TPA: hypothetical protein VFV43_07020, partial [Limnobacter sp.]|nr:hypothetical protein [Limnobacter sp.]